MTREPYKVLSLFAGIGGFDLGLERTGGFKTVAFCEIDPFCRRVLAKHWPEVPCYEDVKELTGERLRADGVAVDCIVGGFPCQDISFAGKGAGLNGERSGLWFEFARLIGELRPRYVIVENVAALLSRGLGDVLGTLASLGYDAEWHCIPACSVGAPHRRDRVWILAYPDRGLHAGGLDAGEDCRAPGRGESRDLGEGQTPHGQRIRSEFGASGQNVADTKCEQQRQDALPGRRDARVGGKAKGQRRKGSGSTSGRSGILANTAGERCGEARERQSERQAQWSRVGRPSLSYTDAINAQGLIGRRNDTIIRREQIERQARLCSGAGKYQNWSAEPAVGRVAHGIPDRVGQLRAYGNAVVPQIPELIGRAILEAESR